MSALSNTSEYSHRVFQAAKLLDRSGSSIQRDLLVAGRAIRVHFSNGKLESLLSKAFIEPSATEQRDPGLSIFACDFDSTAADYPAPPWRSEWGPNDNTNIQRPMVHFKDERFVGLYEPRSFLLSILDTETNQAIWCVPKREQIPHYELSAPFRPILHWWLDQHGLQIVHAGAVGNRNVAVLLVGRSGSGKSTTALAALDAGLHYLGDDYVLVEDLETQLAWSLYRTGKLFQPDLESLPRLAAMVDDAHFHDCEKTILYLRPASFNDVDHGLTIRAVLLPTVMDTEISRLEKVSPATCLSAMAPSTMLQLRGSGKRDFDRLGRLAFRVPAYRLELGSDRAGVQKTLLDLVDSCNS